MDLPNSHFRDYPIEFKEINPKDFPLFEVNNKEIIHPNEEGYINDSMQSKIQLEEKNSVVLNAFVGCGKSYAIIQTIKEYYNNTNYLIIVASPYVSLVEQYVNDIHKDANIPKEDIYNYTDLGRDFNIPYLNKRVQVLTANTLLGNPGEDGFKNSEVKRNYLNALIRYCEDNGTKAIFIYDEIHDAIQNFQEEFIFNLWKWKDVIHKNFIISATFNEASKIVIEYLAELTDKKIQILESERVKIPQKQSKLYLHFSSEHNFTNETFEIVKVVEDLLNRNKEIDILCYSKTLAKSILQDKKGIGKKLKDRFGQLNNCTSELVSNQRTQNEAPKNRYKNDKCNIGTNFKTGVSIRKENHGFIIVLPPRATRLWFRNKYGIFSGGINDIIQALARQREKGEIHIILPRPDRFDSTSLENSEMTQEQINVFMEAYNKVHYFNQQEEPVKYFPLNMQSFLMSAFYHNELENNVASEIELIGGLNRTDLTRLDFPSYNLFTLNRSEEYIANTFKFFGEDIAAYVAYCAFTNQFMNCELAEVNYKTELFFKENEIQKGLHKMFNKYIGEDYYQSLIYHSNFKMIYSDFRKVLFENFNLRYQKANSNNWTVINPYNNPNFEVQLVRFIALKFFANAFNHSVSNFDRFRDLDYSRSNYFLDCITVASTINLTEVNYSEETKKKIRIFYILKHFREKLIENIREYDSNNLSFRYLKNKPTGVFNENDTLLFNELMSLIRYDELLENNVYEFKRTYSINTLYTRLIEDNFEFTSDRLPSGSRLHIKKIISVKPLPNPASVINLLEPAEYINIDLDENWMIQNYGSLENYEANQKTILEAIEEYTKSQ
ncbi:MAG TPA: DEAD/DEAH box helicase family protein [Flavobacterium sp.]|uniref:DEAD/DEAH box helicase n=1 Tax=unclassified Flavobacterium TaxID=196869 RepID=UPI0025C560B3|nr:MULTISPECIES: DEAD/DEAH box helicase [unclassified Flavobacterium]HRE78479.1 DEAD/DEAH box helicase family protein [Flavobacterium sp.]